MHLRRALTAVILAALGLNAGLGQTPLGTGFTYQGQLKQNGQPYSGSANLVFKLFDAASGGNLLGTQTLSNVTISGGLFTVLLNANGELGASAFNGSSRWLEVTANGTLLTPRQPLTATPYAEFAAAPWTASGANLSYTGGNVGIGTAAPISRLHVDSGADANLDLVLNSGLSAARISAIDLFDRGVGVWSIGKDVGNAFYIDQTGVGRRVTITSAGNVGVDTVPSATLHVNGNVGVGVANIPVGLTSELNGGNTPILNLDVNFRHPNLNANFVGGALRIDARNDGVNHLFQFISRPAGSNTEAVIAALARDGRLVIGAPSFNTDYAQLELSGSNWNNIVFNVSGHSRHGRIEYFADHFDLWNDSSLGAAELQDDGSWTTLSDRRMKTDITPAEGLLAKALALRPVEFYMKNQDRTRDPDKHIGLIAQEVQPVLPSLVSGDDMLSLNYDRLGVVTIGAIQGQQALIADQKQLIEAQQERIRKLEGQVAANTSDANAKDARINDLIGRVEKLETLVGRLANEQPSPGLRATHSVPVRGE